MNKNLKKKIKKYVNWCQKYKEFQFEVRQGKKLTKGVKIIRKIKNLGFSCSKEKKLFIFIVTV